MKKKLFLLLLIPLLLLPAAFLPFDRQIDRYGTSSVRTLFYRTVCWNRKSLDGALGQTVVYFGSDLSKSLDELWEKDNAPKTHTFLASLRSVQGDRAEVAPLFGTQENQWNPAFFFYLRDVPSFSAEPGQLLKITYRGLPTDTSPARVRAISCEPVESSRSLPGPSPWINESRAQKNPTESFRNLRIETIYSDCFFATTTEPYNYRVKILGSVPDDLCPRDYVDCTVRNFRTDWEADRAEAELVSLSESSWKPDPGTVAKPVIYLYPERETEVSVVFARPELLTCTYPLYRDGWRVAARPDGTLTDSSGQTYSYLYWEGVEAFTPDFSEGFCVAGKDTAAFLEKALSKLGLNRREANEFIVYWLPRLEKNPYNILSFQTEVYTAAYPLRISPQPDSLIRVFLAWKGSEEAVGLPPQTLSAPARKGFTVVEWGGMELR